MRKALLTAVAAVTITALAAGGTALVMASSVSSSRIQGGQLGSIAWYTTNYATGASPTQAAFDGSHIWVANGGSNLLTKLTRTGKVVGNYNVGAKASAVAFDGSNLWVASAEADTIRKVTRSGKVLLQVSHGDQPHALVFDGTHVWAGHVGSNRVNRLNLQTGASELQCDVPSPVALLFDGQSLWVSSATTNTVLRLAVATCAVQASVSVGNGPQGLAYDGMSVWVANSGSGTVSKIRTADSTVEKNVQVGEGPTGLAFEQGGFSTSASPNWDPKTYIWVTNNVSNNVMRVDPIAEKVIAVHPAGLSPLYPVFDGSNIWIPNYGSGTVTRIVVR